MRGVTAHTHGAGRSPAFILLAVLRALGIAAVLVALSCFRTASAGVLDKEAMAAAFPPPLLVGEKESDLPVWPIFRRDLTSAVLVGYAFESIDLSPIPGFSGTPYNLLVAISPKGEFMAVRVLSQHEPVFVEGLGEQPLLRFVKQYEGLSLVQNIRIKTSIDRGEKTGNVSTRIDGVAKATASIRILNQTLLSSALKVARAKLGYAQGRDPDLVARIKPDLFEPMGWNALAEAGLITRKAIKNREVEAAFRGTIGEGQDPEASLRPDDDFLELHIAHLDVPTVGRNILHPKAWDYLQNRLDKGDHALLVVSRGRHAYLGKDFVRASVPDGFTLHQKNLPLEMRDFDLEESLELFNLDYKITLPEALRGAEWHVFHVIAPAGLDPAQALEFDLNVTRTKGQFYPEHEHKNFPFSVTLPEKYFDAAQPDDKTWHSIWQDRAAELIALGLGLAVLFGALQKQDWLSRDPRRQRVFRAVYLFFTLGFVGWYAQGQLSIVNITAVVQAMTDGRNLGFLLYDPVTVVLWSFVAVTFFRWGRGAFCGWLCPFGALQELLNPIARLLRIPQMRVRPQTDARLKQLKYALLAAILAVAVVSPAWTSRVVEVEPFKTSITLIFDRAWPFVLWAGALLALGTVVYKGYCRYLCPLGAAMALLGRLRRFDWLTRRAECGQPCQRCRHACKYQAIKKSGEIVYEECFQCLDCVVIYQSDRLCVPIVLENRKARRLTPAGSAVAAPAEPEYEGEPA